MSTTNSAGMFDTHLLSMEEVWFVREHPFNVACVKVKNLVKDIALMEAQLEVKRKALDEAAKKLNERMSTT